MKKKVALLLVLVMILSALPMNVFGDDDTAAQWILSGASVSGGFIDRDETHTFDVRLPLNAMWPMMTFHHEHNQRDTLRMVMDITQAGFPDVPVGGLLLNHNLVEASALIGGTRQNLVSPEAFSVRLTGTSGTGAYARRTGIVEVTFHPGFLGVTDSRALSALVGALEFSIDLTSRNNADWVNSTMTLSGQTGAQQTHLQRFVTNWPLVWREEGNVIIDVNGGARGFSSQLHCNPIRVRETRFGVLPNRVTLRLEAPAFYTWSFTPYDEVTITGENILGGRSGAEHQLRAHPTGSISSATITAIHSRRPAGAAGRHVIYLTVDLGRNDGLRPLVGGFEFRNLWLLPDGNAATSGNVYVNAQLGHWTAGTAGIPGHPGSPTQNIYQYSWVISGDAMTADNYVRANDTVLVDGNGNLVAITLPLANPRGPILEAPTLFAAAGGDPNGLGPSGQSMALPSGITLDNLSTWTNAAQRAQFVWVIPVLEADGTTILLPVPHTTPDAELVLISAAVSRLQLPFATWTRGALIGQIPGVPPSAGTPGTDSGFVVGVGRGGYRATLHVGTRGMAGLTAHVYHEQNMRTGHLGQWRPSVPTTWAGQNEGTFNPSHVHNETDVYRIPGNVHNGGLAHFMGVATSTLIIQENIAGAFTVGFGSPINFEFLDDNGNPHPGIRILGIQARAGNNYRDRHRDRTDGAFYGNNRNNWFTFAGWLSALDQRLPVSPNVGRLSDTGATLYMTSQTIADVVNPGALEVRFFLSLEAGYEWKYGDAVYVTLSGAGISNLPEAERRIRIGTAVDPIQTNVTNNFPVVDVETGTLYNIIGRHPIENVTFDVINPNAFNIGDEIWLYVTSDVLARSFDLNLSGIPTISVEGSALRFDTGRLVNPQVGRGGREAVVFTVTRMPNVNEEPTVTISNLQVEGQAFPGVEYQIVVSGTAIANNDQEVFHASRTETAYGTQIRTMNRGVFTSLPYHGTVVTNDGDGRWDGAPGGPGTTQPPQQLPQNQEFRLQEGVPFGGVAEPLIWHIVGPNRVGMVSMRAFAVLIGASDDQIVWDSENRVAQIHGTHFNGETVGISVQVGNTNATVQIAGANQTVDIATAVNFLSGPAGSVQPLFLNGVAYLPLRFVAETFGYTVERQGNIVIFR